MDGWIYALRAFRSGETGIGDGYPRHHHAVQVVNDWEVVGVVHYDGEWPWADSSHDHQQGKDVGAVALHQRAGVRDRNDGGRLLLVFNTATPENSPMVRDGGPFDISDPQMRWVS